MPTFPRFNDENAKLSISIPQFVQITSCCLFLLWDYQMIV